MKTFVFSVFICILIVKYNKYMYIYKQLYNYYLCSNMYYNIYAILHNKSVITHKFYYD